VANGEKDGQELRRRVERRGPESNRRIAVLHDSTNVRCVRSGSAFEGRPRSRSVNSNGAGHKAPRGDRRICYGGMQQIAAGRETPVCKTSPAQCPSLRTQNRSDNMHYTYKVDDRVRSGSG
jgi:hypothetical protein